MRSFTLILASLTLGAVLVCAGCTPADTEAAPQPDDGTPCRSSAGQPLTESDSTELVLAGASRAQANDLRCGPPDDRTRICRALVLVATVDPALHLEDESLRQRTSAALQWALQDAQAVAPPHLIDALETLETATHTLTTSADDQSLSDALALRAQPAVTDAIDEHWRSNCR